MGRSAAAVADQISGGLSTGVPVAGGALPTWLQLSTSLLAVSCWRRTLPMSLPAGMAARRWLSPSTGLG
eukprot:11826515-Alexandrium_andersonii.AAC.1